MTMTRPMRLLLVDLVGGLVAALALGGAGCTSYPSPPSQPAFDTDVLPIFEAHCNRCHGNGPDGGSLNTASVPGMVYPDGGGPIAAQGPFLTQFGDTCSPLADGSAGTCQNGADCPRCGAFIYAGELDRYLNPDFSLRMPPPPAPLLNDYELKVVKAWAAHPICSNSANPDPTICPAQ